MRKRNLFFKLRRGPSETITLINYKILGSFGIIALKQTPCFDGIKLFY